MEFIKWKELTDFLTEACEYYEKSAPTVHDYLNDLYIRLGDMKSVAVTEILFVQRLKENDIWLNPNHAANQLYHLMVFLKMDTTGHAGF